MKKRNVILPLGALACWLMLGVPGALHAQAKAGPQQDPGQQEGPGQQGNFEGEHTDAGDAAVDTAEGKETKDSAEVERSPRATELAESATEKETSTDADRVEDQKSDLTVLTPNN